MTDTTAAGPPPTVIVKSVVQIGASPTGSLACPGAGYESVNISADTNIYIIGDKSLLCL
jgi:hypothetical protein